MNLKPRVAIVVGVLVFTGLAQGACGRQQPNHLPHEVLTAREKWRTAAGAYDHSTRALMRWQAGNFAGEDLVAWERGTWQASRRQELVNRRDTSRTLMVTAFRSLEDACERTKTEIWRAINLPAAHKAYPFLFLRQQH